MGFDPMCGLDVRAVIDSLPYYVMLIDEHHEILMVNQAVYRTLGKLPEDLPGRKCPQAIHGIEGTHFHGCPLLRARETGEDAEDRYFDEIRGLWIETGVYPTGYSTSQGARIFLHTAREVSAIHGDSDEIGTASGVASTISVKA